MQKYREEIFRNQQFGTGVFLKLLMIGMETLATSVTELARVHYSVIATVKCGHDQKQSSWSHLDRAQNSGTFNVISSIGTY
jgi:predicted lysophospholipase L1 biosynthesis ABC-type transport system permease subunit